MQADNKTFMTINDTPGGQMLIDTIAYLKMNCPNMTDDIGGAMWEQASKYFHCHPINTG